MKSRISAAACAAMLVAGVLGGAHRANAAAIITVSGTLDGTLTDTSGTSTIAGADFTAVAELGTQYGSGGSIYYEPSTVTFSVQGVGALTPLTGATVTTLGPPINTGQGTYGVVLYDSPFSLNMFFDGLSSQYAPNSDVLEILYSNEQSVSYSSPPTLALTSGGSFAITSFDSIVNSIPLLAPEPGSLALLASGLLGLTGLGAIRRRNLRTA
jgi:hypothetical protein